MVVQLHSNLVLLILSFTYYRHQTRSCLTAFNNKYRHKYRDTEEKELMLCKDIPALRNVHFSFNGSSVLPAYNLADKSKRLYRIAGDLNRCAAVIEMNDSRAIIVNRYEVIEYQFFNEKQYRDFHKNTRKVLPIKLNQNRANISACKVSD